MEELEQNEELDEVRDVSDVSYDDLELIEMIKLYPGLWNNSLKIYSKVEDKNLIWALIGRNLTTPLSGPEVQKKFVNWRSTFGRLHKTVLKSQPKSGSSGDEYTYVPTWPLYNELLFLRDVIKPRSTKSNFVKLSSSTQLDKPSVNIYKSTSIHDSSSESVICDHSFHDSQTDISDASSVMSTVTKPEELFPKKKVKIETPPPDHFFKKKKIKNDEDINVLKDMADTIRTMTATLTSTSASPSSKQRTSQDSHRPAEMLNPEVEGFLEIVKGSLGRISPTSRLTCLIELLPILQKYEEV